MATIIPHGELYLKDGNDDGIFNIHHPDDQVFDSKGHALTTSQALETDPTLSQKFEITNPENKTSHKTQRAQSFALGYAKSFSPTSPSTKAIGRAQLTAGFGMAMIGFGAFALIWNPKEQDLDLDEINPDFYTVPLTDPIAFPIDLPDTGETFIVFNMDRDDERQVVDEDLDDLPEVEVDYDEAVNTAIAISDAGNEPGEIFKLLRRLESILKPEFSQLDSDEKMYLGNYDDEQNEILNILSELAKKSLRDDFTTLVDPDDLEWSDVPQLLTDLVTYYDTVAHDVAELFKYRYNHSLRTNNIGSAARRARIIANHYYSNSNREAAKIWYDISRKLRLKLKSEDESL